MKNSFQTLVSFAALLALAVVTTEAQTMPTPDPACPANTIVSTPFNMPNGTACVLCSFIMDRCAASCSGSSADALQCSTDPEGCGEVVCPDGPPAPAPPTPVPPAPTPPAPTAGPVTPPPDVGTPEQCGIANAVGCVLCGNGSDGSSLASTLRPSKRTLGSTRAVWCGYVAAENVSRRLELRL